MYSSISNFILLRLLTDSPSTYQFLEMCRVDLHHVSFIPDATCVSFFMKFNSWQARARYNTVYGIAWHLLVCWWTSQRWWSCKMKERRRPILLKSDQINLLQCFIFFISSLGGKNLICAFGPWIWIQSETSDESL